MARPKTERKIFIRIQLNENSFSDVAEFAAKSGIRDKSCILYNKVPNGNPNETIPNTKSLTKYLLFCHQYYKENEPRRLKEQAEAMQALKDAEEKARAVGVR